MFSAGKTWEEARDDCLGRGYDLAKIYSAAENAALTDKLTGQHWIGLRDKYHEGQYEWLNSDIASYTNWGAGEPNNVATGGEDCVEILESGRWNDLNCDLRRNHACEVRARDAAPLRSSLHART